MKNLIRKTAILAFALVFVFLSVVGAYAKEDTADVTVLFTHDLHSHLLPSRADDGSEYGGYARLMHVIREQMQ